MKLTQGYEVPVVDTGEEDVLVLAVIPKAESDSPNVALAYKLPDGPA